MARREAPKGTGSTRDRFIRAMTEPMRTPDGRYLVIDGKLGPRLWRASNPALSNAQRQALVAKLMDARRALRAAGEDRQVVERARADVDQAKRDLGERGPVWWTDGAADFNRRLVKNSPYRSWWEERSTGGSSAARLPG